MADKKISQLAGSTTPLAGTEVLPIVQSSTTKKVAVSDLTAGRTVAVASLQSNTGGSTYSNYTTGHFQAGVALATNTTNGGVLVGATTTGTELAYLSLGRSYNLSDVGEIALATGAAKKVMIGTANVARITAETSGDVTVNTGNLVVGTAAKGIDFSANTGAAGETSSLLNWYEEGTWTPTVRGSGTAGTYEIGTNGCTYTRIGRQVTLNVYIQMAGTVTGGGTGDLQITGVPYAKAANANPVAAVYLALGTFTGNPPTASWNSFSSSSTIILNQIASGGYGTAIPISYASANAYITFSMTYFV